MQKDKKQAELEKQLVQLKVELQAISRQAEQKETQVKLEKEMKELETVLMQLNKSNTASGQALQNYIAVGRSGYIDRIKALTNLSKEQNQLRILLEESKKRGDEKQAVEFEKMIDLFRVREDQAKAQADQAQRQYRVAATQQARDVALIKAPTAYSTTGKVTGGTQLTGGYALASSVKKKTGGVLVIPSGKPMDAEEYKLAVENMQTMALILKKKLDMGATAVAFGMLQGSQNQILNLTGSAGDVQAIYLEGYGALFLMTVDYPLLAPVEKKVEPKEKVEDDVWEKADLVFDCLDSIVDRLVLARKCSAANCTLVHGAVAGWYGEVGIVRPGSKMLEKHYQSQREGLEKELGTPVFTAAVAASLMAAKGCRILTDKCQSKQSTMHFFDLLADDWENIQL